MGRGASLSLLGMYNWDDSLFNTMAFPSGFDANDKTLFVNNLVMECAELEVLYSDWDFLKFAIEIWSKKEVLTWERIYQASILHYNPIENYNRNEDVTETHSGKDTNQASGKDTNQASGNDVDAHTGNDALAGSGADTDIHSKTSFDNNTYAATDKLEMQKGSTQTNTYNSTLTHTNGRKDEFTHGKKEEFTHGHTIRRAGNISGNIGVTTSQQMLEQELEVSPKLNIINYMIESFRNRFCLLVY